MKEISESENKSIHLQKINFPKDDNVKIADWEYSIKQLLDFLIRRGIFKAVTWSGEKGKNVNVSIWVKKEDIPVLREYLSLEGHIEIKDGLIIQ